MGLIKRFLNGMGWVSRIILGLILAYFLLISVGMLFTPYTADALTKSNIKLNELQADVSRSANKNQQLQASVDRLSSSNKELRSQLDESGGLEAKEKTAEQVAAVAVTPPSSDNKITTVFGDLKQRSFMVLSIGDFDFERCDERSKEIVGAWLQFVLLYRQHDLKGFSRDKSSVKNSLIANAGLLNDLSEDDVISIRPLVSALMEYHRTITARTHWQESMATAVVAKGRDGVINEIYQLGFPKSDNACLASKIPLGMAVSAYRYYSGYTSLESWLYSFWARRYQEGTFDLTYLGLQLAEMAFEKTQKPEFSALIRRNMIRAQKPVSDLLPDIYHSLLVARVNRQGINIAVGRESTPPKANVLYAFNQGGDDGVVSYVNTASYTLPYSEETHFTHQYRGSETNDRAGYALYSTSQLDMPRNIYQKSGVDANDISNINALVGRYLKGTHNVFQAGTKCSAEFSQDSVTSFENGSNKVFLLQKHCGTWVGEGTRGTDFVAIASRDGSGEMFLKHIYIGFGGRLNIDDGYIADLDSDGNIEVFIKMQSGLGSDSYLVELSGNNWDLLRNIEQINEQEVHYLDATNNQKILYQ